MHSPAFSLIEQAENNPKAKGAFYCKTLDRELIRMMDDNKNKEIEKGDNDEKSSSISSPITERMVERKRKHDARSNRKREREKKRRSDVNQGFDRLLELLAKIDPVEPSASAAEAELTASDAAGGAAPSNRVNLISRVNIVLSRLHEENQLLRKQVKEGGAGEKLPSGNTNARSSTDEAFLLVPVMIPLDAPYPGSEDSSIPVPLEDLPPGSIYPDRIRVDGSSPHHFRRVAGTPTDGGRHSSYSNQSPASHRSVERRSDPRNSDSPTKSSTEEPNPHWRKSWT